ncbi:MAG: hypothetical protein IT440_06830 [Phycisphaeraceae bacterium]|nr:hypothetical protein [Phycisphaeraceae bacterium]
MTCHSRSQLCGALREVFSSWPQVSGIHVFGRDAEGLVDAYSDIDLVICCDDPARGYDQLHDGLAQVAPIVGSYLIHADAAELAQMFMLDGYSPYQKIDLSLVSRLEQKAVFAPFRALYVRSSPPASHGITTLPDLASVKNSLTNQLHDVLFSIPRFTKCLFRGERDMYRRWHGVAEILAALLYESCFGWSMPARGRLAPQEYKRLFHHLLPSDAEQLDRIQPLDGRPDLCDGFVHAVQWIVRLYQTKAAHMNLPLDTSLADRLLPFLEQEILRFRQRS